MIGRDDPGLIAFAAVAAYPAAHGLACRRRIGVTGDTLGATIEIFAVALRTS